MAHASLPESPAPAPRRWRGLLALGLLVAAVHLLLLQAMPLPRHSSDIAPPMAFSTRTITLNPPPAPAPPPDAAAAPPAKPAPARPARPRPRPALPPATVAQAPALPEPAPQEAPATPVAEAPPPAPEPVPAASAPVVVAEAPAEPLAQAPAEVPITIPGSVRLLYDVQGQVKKMDYKARSELLWRQDGSQYDLRFEVSAFLVGSRVQTSRGKLTAQGLTPERFSDKSRNERAAHFNYDQGKITFSANSPDAPLAAGMQDRLSVFIQLGALLAGSPGAFPPGTTISQATVGPRDADLWKVTVAGEETLQVLGEEVKTLRLTRPPGQQYDSQVELWYAPSMGYLPVRIRLTQPSGDFADMQLRATEAP